MPISYTPAELREYIKDKKWIMQYNELAAVVDPKTEKVWYIESYGPKQGFFIEGWRALHYPITSKLVEKSWREGGYTIALIHQGHSGLDLKPSMAPFGISDCEVKKDSVELGFEGIGGAGVSVAFSRGTARGVTKTLVIEEGGGGKTGKSVITLPKKRLLLIGVDDTDNEVEGATYALVHNIAESASKKTKSWYAIHVNVQLYPYNKFKTRNCFATVVGIIFETEEQKIEIIRHFEKQIKKYTCSPNTAMATFEGFCFQNQYLDYANSLKFRVAHDIDELKSIAQKQDIQMHVITGERGLFGAIGALAYFDRPDYAAKLPTLLI